MNNRRFAHIDMSNPPINGTAFDYITWVRQQMEMLQVSPDIDAVVLTVLVPSRNLVQSREADLASWPQLRQLYEELPQGAQSSAQRMTPTFLRAVADLVDEIIQKQSWSQHANPQPQQVNNMQAAEVPNNPSMPGANVVLPAQATPTPIRPYDIGMLTPQSSAHYPAAPAHLAQPYTPAYQQDSNVQARMPVIGASPLASYNTGVLTPTPQTRPPNPSAYNRPTNYPPIPLPTELSSPLPSIFSFNGSATAHPSPAPSSTHHGGQTPRDAVSGPYVASHPLSELNPFQRSASSASFQSQAARPASVDSHGSLHNTRASPAVPGRRPLGGRGLIPSSLHMGSADNGNNNNLMDFDGPMGNGQAFR